MSFLCYNYYMKKLEDYKAGDIILLVTRMRVGYETRCARITAVNYNNLGIVTYSGENRGSILSSGQGAFTPNQIGSKEFGLQEVKIIGHRSPTTSRWTPAPGNRAYDLCC